MCGKNYLRFWQLPVVFSDIYRAIVSSWLFKMDCISFKRDNSSAGNLFGLVKNNL
jgi:hypothetical protein